MTAATEQQTRPLVVHLEAAGYRHQPASGSDPWESWESRSVRVVIRRADVHVHGFDGLRYAWSARFTSSTPDSRIVAFLSAEEKGMSDA